MSNYIYPGWEARRAAERITVIDRSEVSRCLAKAIAYKQCGKDALAAEWGRKLIEALELAEILVEVPARPRN